MGGGILMLHAAEWRCELGAGGRRGGEVGDYLVSVCLMKESQIIPTMSTWALRWPCACVCVRERRRRRSARRGKVRFAASRNMNPALPAVHVNKYDVRRNQRAPPVVQAGSV